MDFSRHTYTSSRMRMIHAILGVLTFLLVNGLLLGLFLLFLNDWLNGWLSLDSAGFIVGLAALLVNVGLLVYFGFTRYWFTLGPLAVLSFLFSGVLLFSTACSSMPVNPGPTWTPFVTSVPRATREPPSTPTAPITQTAPMTQTTPMTGVQTLSPTEQSD